jgi:hypothetical protein
VSTSSWQPSSPARPVGERSLRMAGPGRPMEGSPPRQLSPPRRQRGLPPPLRVQSRAAEQGDCKETLSALSIMETLQLVETAVPYLAD